MNIQIFRKAVLVLALAGLSCLLVASTDGAILMSDGPVLINGGQVSNSSTVFPGDRVQTAKASAVVKSTNALISIGNDSLVKYDGASITLERGIASVSIGKHMDTHLGNLLISAAPGAKFQVMNTNGLERVAAIEGSLSVTDGTKAVTLAGGEMMTHTSKPEPDAPPLNVGGRLPGWSIELMSESGIAGGVVGGMAATGNFKSSRPASPSGP